MRERIKQVIAKAFNIPAADIPDDAAINAVPNWDSLGHMILMLELEAEFDLSISTVDMTNLLSLELIETYLNNRGQPAGVKDSSALD